MSAPGVPTIPGYTLTGFNYAPYGDLTEFSTANAANVLIGTADAALSGPGVGAFPGDTLKLQVVSTGLTSAAAGSGSVNVGIIYSAGGFQTTDGAYREAAVLANILVNYQKSGTATSDNVRIIQNEIWGLLTPQSEFGASAAGANATIVSFGALFDPGGSVFEFSPAVAGQGGGCFAVQTITLLPAPVDPPGSGPAPVQTPEPGAAAYLFVAACLLALGCRWRRTRPSVRRPA